MTRFLSTVAAVALLAAPIAATAQTGGIPGGATQAPNPSPASSSVSQPRPAPAPAPMPAATPAPAPAPAPVTPAAKPMPMKRGKAKPMMHHAAKPMAGKGRAMSRSRDSQDNAVDALNAQSLARAQGR